MTGTNGMLNSDAFERRRLVQQHFVGRVSCELFDPGYRNYMNLIRAGYEIFVYLNDEPQDGYLTADPDEGFLQRRVYLRATAKTEVRRGSVTIKVIKKSVM
jgi:hypothetical protein